MATQVVEGQLRMAVPVAPREVAFLLLDGLRRSRPAGRADVALCALGLTRDGAPHPLALRVVPSEEDQTWRTLLQDLRADGIGRDLLLICSDGHPALVKAIHAVYPEVPVQISVAHRLLALARKVDVRWRGTCLAEARRVFAATDRAAAVALFREWHTKWLRHGEPAVRSLEADLASCLTFYRFPAPLWSKIRTVNLVERVFRDARHAARPADPSPDLPTAPARGAAVAADIPTASHPASPAAEREDPAPAPRPADEAALVAEDDEVPAPVATTSVDAPAASPAARVLDLMGDEAFEIWLLAYRRRSIRVKAALTITSLAGLITGLVLSLGR